VSTEFFRIVRLIKLKDSEAARDQRRNPSLVKTRNVSVFAAAAHIRAADTAVYKNEKLACESGSSRLHWTIEGTLALYPGRAQR
jgi:hypothetical protein